jgi:hypothetical protein
VILHSLLRLTVGDLVDGAVGAGVDVEPVQECTVS